MQEEERVLAEIVQYEDRPENQLLHKFLLHIEILNRWLYIKNLGLSLGTYFERNHYHRIAIYGMAELGCRLLEELQHSGIQAVYGIDKNPLAANVRNQLCIITPEECWGQEIDAVIVTPVFYYDELKSMISSKVKCPVISLKEVIWQI